jgi:hypothetical protein
MEPRGANVAMSSVRDSQHRSGGCSARSIAGDGCGPTSLLSPDTWLTLSRCTGPGGSAEIVYRRVQGISPDQAAPRTRLRQIQR